jgi:hypothetical protein
VLIHKRADIALLPRVVAAGQQIHRLVPGHPAVAGMRRRRRRQTTRRGDAGGHRRTRPGLQDADLYEHVREIVDATLVDDVAVLQR